MSTEKSLREDVALALGSEYEIVRELGRGGVSVVYLARDRVLGREVAIKLIRDSHSGDPEQIARLAREARTLAALQHPNIVMLYGAKQLPGGTIGLVMQYGEWVTLKSVIREQGALPLEAVEQVLGDVASALQYLHQNRIVHRDIKPENIFIEAGTGRALLSDFGIAKSGDAASSVTLTGVVIGTPAYMSPEQIDGGTLTGRSDLYSLGMVGYEMLTGIRPWEGESLFSVIYKQKSERLPSIREQRPDVPDRLIRLIERATQKDAARRWESAEAFLHALAAPQEPRAAGAWAEEMTSAGASSAPAGEYPTLEIDRLAIGRAFAQRDRTRRRNRRLLAAAVVLLLFSGGAGALAFSERLMGGEDRPATGTEVGDAAQASPSEAPYGEAALLRDGAPSPGSESAGQNAVLPDSSVSVAATTERGDVEKGNDEEGSPPAPLRVARSEGASVTQRTFRQVSTQRQDRYSPPAVAPSVSVTRPTDTTPQIAETEVLQPLDPTGATTPQLQNREAVAQLLADRYPTDLRVRGVGGTTVLTVLVAADGSVEQSSVVASSGNPRLDETARAVSTQMLFRHPFGAMRRAVWVAVPLTFNPG